VLGRFLYFSNELRFKLLRKDIKETGISHVVLTVKGIVTTEYPNLLSRLFKVYEL